MDKRKFALKRLKSTCKYVKRQYVTGWKFAAIFTLVLCILFASFSIGLQAFDKAVASAWGGSFWHLANKDTDASYFPMDFSSQAELTEYSQLLNNQVAGEGAVLLLNRDHTLPLQAGATVSCFFDTLSNSLPASKDSLKTAFEEAGFAINESLWSAYQSNTLPQYTDELLSTVSDTAVVFATQNGETLDLLQLLYNKKSDGSLQRIVLLICTPYGVQIEYAQDSRLDGVLWLGETDNAQVVAEILAGKINPSGKLTETYLHTAKSAENIFTYASASIPDTDKSYTICREGIYSGYKYYETRYEDAVMGTGNAGKYSYPSDVAYPFGFGLSYTTFAHSDMSVAYDTLTDRFEVSVTVSNTGSVAGKDVVQVYAQTPYTDYDKAHFVEKASLNLVGFSKTKLLQPGEKETVTVFVQKRDLTSYDWHGAGTYILDAGDYYLTAASDAHNAVNNILSAKGYSVEDGDANFTYSWSQEHLDTTTYATTQNGSPITNRFSSANPNLYKGIAETVTWVSRQDWEGTLTRPANPFPMTPLLHFDLQNKPSYSPADYPTVSMPTTGAQNDLKLYDLRKLAFDDPLWQGLLDQLTFDEMVSLVLNDNGWRAPAESVQAPGGRICDSSDFMPASNSLLSATFNSQLVYDVGKVTGNLCLGSHITNLSVSPCDSEDSFLSGKLSAQLILGMQDKGIDVLVAHSAQDNGVWLHEQTIRERYLRVYEYAFTEGKAGGIIASPIRWGTGAEDSFLEHILRGEWGSRGMVVVHTLDNMTGADALMAGITAFAVDNRQIVKDLSSYQNDPVIVSALRQACHYNLYALVNGSGMNGIGENTTVKARQLPLISACIAAAIVCGLLTIGFGFLWYQRNKAFQKTEEYLAYQALKNTVTDEFYH